MVVSVAVLMAYHAIRTSLAVHAREEGTLSGYERATRLAPTDPENWQKLGNYWQNEARIPDFALAIRAYREGLSVDPRSYKMWLDIAMAYEAENQVPEARAALASAERAYPLSPDAAWRYGNFLLRQDEIPEGLNNLHRSVELDPAYAAEAFSIGSKVLPDSDIGSVLKTVIPPSSETYVAVLDELVAKRQLDDAIFVWSLIYKMDPKLPLETGAGLVYSLWEAGRPRESKRVWDEASKLAHFNFPQSLPGSLIWDGGFESGANNFGFAWNYQSSSEGVQIFQDPTEKHSGTFSLRVSFDGTVDLTFHDVCEHIPIDGLTSYSFSAWVRTDSLTTDQGVRFGLWALNVPDKNAKLTTDFRGTMPWTRIESQWTAPAGAQEMEICLLRNPSDQPDNKIRGIVWIDDVAIVPQFSAMGTN